MPRSNAVCSPCLRFIAHRAFYADKEFACRPEPEREVWIASVALVASHRWEATGDGEWLTGSPELVIEVLSPSNTAQQMLDREEVFFPGGCREFWIVDSNSQSVVVSRRGEAKQTYRSGESIPLNGFGGSPLPVSALFG